MAGAVVVDAVDAAAPGGAADVIACVAGAAAVAVFAAWRAGFLALRCRSGPVEEALSNGGHSVHRVQEFHLASLAGCPAFLWCTGGVEEALAVDRHC